jgi:sulfur relay (sulfurtransferase) DsrF/TusC family protein
MSAQHNNAFVEHFKLVFFVGNQESPIRAEVTPKAMIQRFNAEMTPRSFLDVYRRQQDFLHSAALAKATSSEATVVLDTEDLDALALKEQQPEAPSAPITLRPASGTGKSYRRAFAQAPAAQDVRFATQIGA